MAPEFIWQAAHPNPVYRHRVMWDFYSRIELNDFQHAQTPSGFAGQTVQRLGIVLFFLLGPTLMLPLIMLPRVLRDRRVRLALVIGVFALGVSVNTFFFPHYVSAFTGVFYLVLIQAMRHLRLWHPGDQPVGLFLVRVLPVICLGLAAVRLGAQPLKIDIGRWPAVATWYGPERPGGSRASVLAELENRPGRQLAIVRYAAGHSVFDDWVYNSADIDGSHVVWAREMGADDNRALLSYFKDRLAWLVEPDCEPPRIQQFAALDLDHNSEASSGLEPLAESATAAKRTR
jgi:hypothetical protein